MDRGCEKKKRQRRKRQREIESEREINKKREKEVKKGTERRDGQRKKKSLTIMTLLSIRIKMIKECESTENFQISFSKLLYFIYHIHFTYASQRYLMNIFVLIFDLYDI